MSRVYCTAALLVLCLMPGTTASVLAQGVRGFGPPQDSTPAPGFGPYAELARYVTANDRRKVADLMRRLDSDRNDVLDAAEMKKGNWNQASVELNDLDGDGSVTIDELYVRHVINRSGVDRPDNERRADKPSDQPYESTESTESTAEST